MGVAERSQTVLPQRAVLASQDLSLTVLPGGGDEMTPTDLGGVTKVPLAPAEWALVMSRSPADSPSRQSLTEFISRAFVQGSVIETEAAFTAIRLPPAANDPDIGPAVLHHSPAGLTLLCPDDQITTEGARAFGLIVQLLLPVACARGTSCLATLGWEALTVAQSANKYAPPVTIVPVPAEQMDEDLRPMFGNARAGQLKIWVACDQTSPVLESSFAPVLASLLAAQAACLADLQRRGKRRHHRSRRPIRRIQAQPEMA